MSKSLTVHHNRIIDRNLQQELASRIREIDDNAKLVRLAVQESSKLRSYTANKARQTLIQVEQMVQEAYVNGWMTEEKKRKIDELTDVYLWDLLWIVFEVDVEMIDVILAGGSHKPALTA